MLKSIGWSVFVFFRLHSVCFYDQSPGPGKGALRENLSSFLFSSCSRAWRDSGLACIAVDMTFQISYSSFGWMHSIKLGWEGRPARPCFGVWLGQLRPQPESIPFPLKLLVAPTLLVSILHGTFV